MPIFELVLQQKKTWKTALCCAFMIFIFSFFLALCAGEIWVNPLKGISDLEQQIVLNLRFPRVIAATLIGASLAVSGCILQVLLRNPLAEPGVLGISGGASLALVIVLFLFPAWSTPYFLMTAAISGAMVFTAILVSFARSVHVSTSRLLLIGIGLGILSSALVTWAFYFSSDQDLRQLMFWLMGSLSGVDWQHLFLGMFILPILIWLFSRGHQLDLLMLGEVHAQQLGLDTSKLRWKLILFISLLVGMSVAMGGVIGFVGLVVPHFLRLWVGSDNRYLLPLSALSGASLMIVADTLGRISVDNTELPVGAVTSSIGAPLFVWMLMKK